MQPSPSPAYPRLPGTTHDAHSAMMHRAAFTSLIIGGTLVLLKAVAWYVTGSLSMMSSMADSMLDVMASSVNVLALRYALMPPDHEHRFGHGKAEDLAILAQSIFIFGSGIFLIVASLKRLSTPAPIENSAVGIGVMVISIALTLGLVLYQRRVVRETASGAIAADSLHYFTDLLTNIGVIAAILISLVFKWNEADPLIALAIAFYLIYSSFIMTKGAFHNLMDHEFSDEERETIKTIVNANPKVAGLHDLRTRKSGIYSFIQFHLDLDGSMTLQEAHVISDAVEDAIAAAFPKAEILIHQDPLHGDRKSEVRVEA